MFLVSAPKCGFIKGNERIVKLLDIVKPEIMALKETCITVSGQNELINKLSAFSQKYSSDRFILLFFSGFLLDFSSNSKNRGWK